MKKRLLLLLSGLVIIYYLIHIIYDLSGRAYGRAGFIWLPLTTRGLLARLADLAFSSVFTLVPYLALYKLYPRRRIAQILLVIALWILLLFVAYNGMMSWRYYSSERLRSYFIANIFFWGIYFFYGALFYFTSYARDKELEQKDLLLQNRQSELSFLRSQVNPHFLFNSLNNIYSLVYENSPRALPAIAGLSQLMRYMLYDGNEKVTLQQELDYIRQYIELQGIRFEHPVNTQLHISGETGAVQIPALLLIAFVENAFKHGDFGEDSEGLVITVYCSARKTSFYCRNRKGNGAKDAGGGIGLANVQRRLELLYPGTHLLEIEDKPDSFTIHLELIHD